MKDDVKKAKRYGLQWWLTRKIRPPEPLLGSVFTTTSRVLLGADTGAGKTMLALTIALCMVFGLDFLNWECKRKAKVVYIDGELPDELIQARLRDVCKALNLKPSDIAKADAEGRFVLLCRDDFEKEMHPLDTEAGQKWLEGKLDEHEPDEVIFDNLSMLTESSLKEEDGWNKLKLYALSLSSRKIGQFWLAHTGHSTENIYGTKMKEWGMDTVILGTSNKLEHLSMVLDFRKARRRTRENTSDYENIVVELKDGQWVHSKYEGGKVGRPNTSMEPALRAINDLGGRDVENGDWMRKSIEFKISNSPVFNSQKKAFERARDRLIEDRVVIAQGGRYSVGQK